jgi:hypothetical protein
MTALRKYDRLESPGTWRETPEARLREVVVGLREATLVLSDPKTEMALSQWSLPALHRLNPGKVPALFGPGLDDDETLEIDDPEMIAALETLRGTLERRRAKPGRLRGVIMTAAGVALGALAVFWLPGKLTEYTAAMLPPPTRAALGKLALQDLTKLTGSPCSTKAGTAASVALGLRLNPVQPPHVLAVREALKTPIALPGDLVVLPASLLQTNPDAVAGAVLVASQTAASQDLLRPLLAHAGFVATLRLLASGEIDPTALDGYGETLLAPAATVLSDSDLLIGFKTAQVTSSPYAYSLDKSGETTLGLIEADPYPKGSDPAVLDDATWQGLQNICGP